MEKIYIKILKAVHENGGTARTDEIMKSAGLRCSQIHNLGNNAVRMGLLIKKKSFKPSGGWALSVWSIRPTAYGRVKELIRRQYGDIEQSDTELN